MLREREIKYGMIGSNISNQSFKSRRKFIFEDAVAENIPGIMKGTQIQEAKQIQKV